MTAPTAPAIVTAVDVLESQRELEATAAAAYPFKTDQCSYQRGYVAQQLYACVTCSRDAAEPAALCYACHLMCGHAGHHVAELFVKRGFRCDCGTARMAHARDGAHRCQLHAKPPGTLNEGNRYNHNFAQRYCVCDAVYDPDREDGVMYQCIVCQDWFHDRCIEQTVQIPNPDTFAEMICKGCCDAAPFLRNLLPISVSKTPPTPDAPHSIPPTPCLTAPSDPAAAPTYIFLPDDFRSKVCRCAECTALVAAKDMPYLHAEEPIWLPERDPDAETPLFDAGVALLDQPGVDRAKAIEGIYALNDLSAQLKAFFKVFADSGQVVTEQDIKGFFEELKSRKAQGA